MKEVIFRRYASNHPLCIVRHVCSVEPEGAMPPVNVKLGTCIIVFSRKMETGKVG